MKGWFKCNKLWNILIILALWGALSLCTYGESANYETLKYDLYIQGILDQAQIGYAEIKEPTRIDAARIFVRLLGEESTLKQIDLPFKDVKGSNGLYAGYLYEQGYTKGVSLNEFGANKPCDSKLYMRFLLRALGYAEGKGLDFEYVKSLEVGENIGLITSGEKKQLEEEKFTYGKMLSLTAKALQQPLKGTQISLLQKLTECGAIPQLTQKLVLSNIPGQETSFELEDGKLKMSKIPDENYHYIWVQLEDKTTQKVEECDIVTASNGTATVKLPSLANGQYFINIYVNSDRDGTYNSWYWQMIYIEVKDGVIGFMQSPILAHNRQMQLRHVLMGKVKITNADRENPEIKALAMGITAGKIGDYDKGLAIHDWVAEHIYYDYDAYSGRVEGVTNALDVLKAKHSVCEGYANLTSALMEAANIPCRVVSGYALGVGKDRKWEKSQVVNAYSDHAWNEAYIEGRWVIIDTTWDSDNAYENGANKNSDGLRGHVYFDPTIESFSYTHKIMP